MKKTSYIMILVLLVFQVACKHKQKESRPLTPQEEATLVCIKDNLKNNLAAEVALGNKILDKMTAMESTTSLVILERRMKEQHCLSYARCYGDNPLIVDSMFMECIKDVKEDI